MATARKLTVLCWQLMVKGKDYAFAMPSLVAHKQRRLELRAGLPAARGRRGSAAAYSLKQVRAAERDLAAQSELAYHGRQLATPAAEENGSPGASAPSSGWTRLPAPGHDCDAQGLSSVAGLAVPWLPALRFAVGHTHRLVTLPRSSPRSRHQMHFAFQPSPADSLCTVITTTTPGGPRQAASACRATYVQQAPEKRGHPGGIADTHGHRSSAA